jgi:hypothetical protein
MLATSEKLPIISKFMQEKLHDLLIKIEKSL